MSRPVLGAILSQFPRYDEVFILRELAALSQGGAEPTIFSLRPCRDQVIHEQAKPLLPKTVYAPFLWSWGVWCSHAHFIRTRPQAYAGVLRWVLSRHWRHPVILAKTLILFPKVVHFARLAQQRGVAHLHAFWATYPAAAAMIINRLAGIPYSLSGHAHDIHTINPTLVEKMRGAKFVLTCTEENKRYLKHLVNGCSRVDVHASAHIHETTYARDHVIVSYHGVELARFAPVPKSDGSVCYLLAVGSLLPCKGYETLIEACHRLDAQGVPFRCTIAGGGPLERALRLQIARQGLSQRVTITGFVSQEAVVALYQQAHLVVLPLVSKIHWGIPNVLIEALATKTPVICCDLPSMKELIEHGRSGWIIPENDAAALVLAVTSLWSDPALRKRLAEAGYARVVERFSLERTGAQLRDLFASLGQETGGAGQGKTRHDRAAIPRLSPAASRHPSGIPLP